MKDTTGREVACPDDKTDHGGQVIQVASDPKHIGIQTALDCHLTDCPKRGRTDAIIATGSRKYKGISVAQSSDKTVCGAMVIGA
ncbi:conserved hypothetical protein [Burkholderia sp. 8Y]|uniref:PAAR domain-containing protein n=1 Tax=Burkholderia sp. 8Y TaxID=2653133 RepID=UPI0012F367E2|nr:PAAR domain-containing protein [Burkholderia sp. 8Y]VXB50281.1 conserved hypothetical protein [Burkholderia sp. 8Y]